MNIARLVLIIWLSFSQSSEDDLYGVLSSIRRMKECRVIINA